MKELNNKELLNVSGGAFNITSTLLNALIRGSNIFLETGRSLGSSIRRALMGCSCKL